MSNTILDDVGVIKPIDKAQQERVRVEVSRYLDLASELYNQAFEPIPVLFDIKGKTAGMYRVKKQQKQKYFSASIHSQRCLRFNPWLFAKYPEDSWNNTIP